MPFPKKLHAAVVLSLLGPRSLQMGYRLAVLIPRKCSNANARARRPTKGIGRGVYNSLLVQVGGRSVRSLGVTAA
ncbi:uncharacterized protein EDB91DRAFT_1144125 [Suillus paluster]|uniref:uncharacterized protein n=1 Tax=Suillus paluster TaxID=48578 RepID=UPI001B877043|nr:uncharacterized protein EDB91DRAFT_1144125 [Suillus paluster]KAG1735587.1 hypothetical protein EDB91DRAFT_1144125 [Suillus paluster]